MPTTYPVVDPADLLAGYELPAFEFAARRTRRVFCLAGTASVILNDPYSKGKETNEDFDLPKVIAAETFVGGSREWHSTTERYHPASNA